MNDPAEKLELRKGRLQRCPRVVIIILSWNSIDNVKECVQSVKNLDYDNYEVLIVDNSPSCQIADAIANQYPDVTLIRNMENLGYAGGNNVGIRYAVSHQAEYVWLVNNDVIVDSASLRFLISQGQKSKRACLVSPAIYDYYDKSKIQFLGAYIDLKTTTIIHVKDFDRLDELRGNEIVINGTAMLIRCDVFYKIGYFDEDYFLYWEDYDFCFRAGRAGCEISVAASAAVYHKWQSLEEEGGGREKTPRAYVLFYMARNGLWFWARCAHGIQKAFVIKRCVAEQVGLIGHYGKLGGIVYADAILDGIYCASRRKKGSLENIQIKIPKYIKALIRRIVFPHPWIIADLVNFDLLNIIKKVSMRAFKK